MLFLFTTTRSAAGVAAVQMALLLLYSRRLVVLLLLLEEEAALVVVVVAVPVKVVVAGRVVRAPGWRAASRAAFPRRPCRGPLGRRNRRRWCRRRQRTNA